MNVLSEARKVPEIVNLGREHITRAGIRKDDGQALRRLAEGVRNGRVDRF